MLTYSNTILAPDDAQDHFRPNARQWVKLSTRFRKPLKVIILNQNILESPQSTRVFGLLVESS